MPAEPNVLSRIGTQIDVSSVDRVMARLAAKHDGVVDRRQLLASGVSSKQGMRSVRAWSMP